MRFADFDRRRQLAVQHRQALGGQLGHQLGRQRGARLKLVDDDAFQLQAGVMVATDFLQIVQQGIQRPAGKIITVKRNQHPLTGNQRRAGKKVQRRRGVHPNFVKFLGQFVQRVAQLVHLVTRFQLGAQLAQLWVRAHQRQAGKRRGVHMRQRGLAVQAEIQDLVKKIEYRRAQLVGVGAVYIVGQITLRIEIHDQGAPALLGGHCGQVGGDGGFAHPAFLVEHHTFDCRHANAFRSESQGRRQTACIC